LSYELLQWDSDIFGCSIGRIGDVARSSLEETVNEADRDAIDCLYLLCPVDDLRQMHIAIDLGFKPYDLRIEFSRRIETPLDLPGAEVRDARPEEQAALEAMSRERMRETRFWADPHFPRDRVEELYGEWLRRGMTTPAERRTLVPREAVGFVVCHYDSDGRVGTIELIAVGAEQEGGGVGNLLVEAALSSFAEAGMTSATVVTQGRNIAAQALYQRHGYRTADNAVWLHRWREANFSE
jgi:ribosomal protein S18 acetylase RimI-like enzyme